MALAPPGPGAAHRPALRAEVGGARQARPGEHHRARPLPRARRAGDVAEALLLAAPERDSRARAARELDTSLRDVSSGSPRTCPKQPVAARAAARNPALHLGNPPRPFGHVPGTVPGTWLPRPWPERRRPRRVRRRSGSAAMSSPTVAAA